MLFFVASMAFADRIRSRLIIASMHDLSFKATMILTQAQMIQRDFIDKISA